MISGSRRFNFTRREPIAKKHVTIVVQDGVEGEWPTFHAVLTLGSYSLPADAPVYVEAYRQTAWQRFAFGTVGLLSPPEDRRLTEFGRPDAGNVLFRVKVVEPTEGTERAARILAHADQVRPDSSGKKRSLLSVVFGEFRDEVWQLEIDETAGPTLQVSKHLVPDRWALVRSPQFKSLVLPDVFRRILTDAAGSGKQFFEDDRDSWQGRWVRMACQRLGAPKPVDEAWSEDEKREWVEDAVRRFARQQRVGAEFHNWWK